MKKTISVFWYLVKCSFKENKLYIPFFILQTVLSSVASIIAVITPKFIIDELMGNKNYLMIILYLTILIIGSGLIRIINNLLSQHCSNVQDLINRKYHEIYADKCLKMPYSHTERKETLDESRDALNGLNWSGGIGGVFLQIRALITNILSLLGLSVIGLFKAPLIVLCVLMNVAIEVVLNKYTDKKTKDYYSGLSSINRKMDYCMTEMLDFKYAKDIRMYDGSELLCNRSREANNENADKMRSFANSLSTIYNLENLTAYVVLAIEYVYLIFLAINSRITVGDLVSLLAGATAIAGALNEVLSSYLSMNRCSEQMKSFIDFLSNSPKDISGDMHIQKHEHTLELKDVSFKYPGTENYVLSNINLTISPNEKLAVVGLNGAGKTTLIKLICGLYPIASGKILLDGQEIKKYNRDEYLSLFSTVFQDFAMFSGSVKENITFDEKIDESVVINCCEQSEIADRISELKNKYNTQIHKNFDEDGFEPSGGEQQKIALARALYKESEFLILDEPTAAMDAVAESKLYEKFKDISEDKATIFISHRLSSCRFCDRILVLSDGKIAEEGAHDELMKKQGIYCNLFLEQSKNYINKDDVT